MGLVLCDHRGDHDCHVGDSAEEEEVPGCTPHLPAITCPHNNGRCVHFRVCVCVRVCVFVFVFVLMLTPDTNTRLYSNPL